MSAAPDLRLLKPGEVVTVYTLRHLYELRSWLEDQRSNGVYDSWDSALVTKWLAEVKERIGDAELALTVRLCDLEERAARQGVGERALKLLERLDRGEDITHRAQELLRDAVWPRPDYVIVER